MDMLAACCAVSMLAVCYASTCAAWLVFVCLFLYTVVSQPADKLLSSLLACVSSEFLFFAGACVLSFFLLHLLIHCCLSLFCRICSNTFLHFPLFSILCVFACSLFVCFFLPLLASILFCFLSFFLTFFFFHCRTTFLYYFLPFFLSFFLSSFFPSFHTFFLSFFLSSN